MCGRFTLSAAASRFDDLFGLEQVYTSLEPRYNIAPTQDIAIIPNLAPRRLVMAHWGLIPSWSKDRSRASKLINARAETLHEKPSFRQSFQSRRCIIIADGFYEWTKTAAGKQANLIELRSKEVFAFAGLWASWRAPTGELIGSCTIITCKANELVAKLHHRMPVILPRDDLEQWLSLDACSREELAPLLVPYCASKMMSHRVSSQVNDVRNDCPACKSR